MRGSNKYYYLEYTSKQIRERYLNYLKPNLNKECFSLEEDLQICEYVLKNGHHWRKLEKILIGRPEGLIKNRFYGKLKNIIEPYA